MDRLGSVMRVSAIFQFQQIALYRLAHGGGGGRGGGNVLHSLSHDGTQNVTPAASKLISNTSD